MYDSSGSSSKSFRINPSGQYTASRYSGTVSSAARAAANIASRTLVNSVMNRFKRKAKTNVKNMKRRKYSGGSTGYSYADKKIKARRSVAKARRGSKISSMSRGMNFVYEYGTVRTTTDQTIYIGHATCPETPALRAVWTAVVRKLFMKAGMNVISVNQPSDAAVGDRIFVFYQNDPASNWGNNSLTLAAGDTIDTVVDWAVNASRSWFRNLQCKFDIMQYVPALAASPSLSTLRLDSVSLNINYSSRLKIQNRSITSVGQNEITDVDNAPLYGKMYEGYGNGPDITSIFNTAFDLSADDTNGIIYNTGSTAGGGAYAEPLDLNMLRGVKSYGKVLIQPGKIQTNVISYRASGMFNKVLSGCYYTDKSGFLQDKYGIVMLERMMQSAAGESVTIAVEKELKITSNCYEKNMNTATRFTKVIV